VTGSDGENLLARLEALNAAEPADAAVVDDAAMDAVVDGAFGLLNDLRSGLGRAVTGRVVDLASASSRQERVEANKARLLDEGRARTEAVRAAAADTTPDAQRRGYARYLAQRDTEKAHEAWRRGQMIPHRITTALDLRELYGPEVDRACGVEEPAVDEWEAGVRYPTWEQLRALAELTQFPVKFFTTLLPAAPVRVSDTTLVFHMGKRNRVEDREPVLAFTPDAVTATVDGCCVACLDPKAGSRAVHTCAQGALF